MKKIEEMIIIFVLTIFSGVVNAYYVYLIQKERCRSEMLIRPWAKILFQVITSVMVGLGAALVYSRVDIDFASFVAITCFVALAGFDWVMILVVKIRDKILGAVDRVDITIPFSKRDRD